jgi:ABC-2 type transport system permease protein
MAIIYLFHLSLPGLLTLANLVMNPLRGLGQLTWMEIKIFMREPLGAIGTIFIPVLIFVAAGRASAGVRVQASEPFAKLLGPGGIPTLVSISIIVGAVLSLANIISIYREGGILKRLRATPLRPWTILSAHVIVKLLLTALTMALMVLAGRRYFAIGPQVPLVKFTIALLISALSILSVGFIIASIIPTARFAQPIGAVIFYPMIGLSGLFVPIASLPAGLRALARVLPLTYSTSLLQGIWIGDAWSKHLGDIVGLTVVFIVCTALTSRVFRWE